MSNQKKAIDISGFEDFKKSQLENSEDFQEHYNNRGVANDVLVEPVPRYNKADGEKIVGGRNNNSIVFGRDRPYNKMSGYGGTGDTQAGSIDIVVGRMGSKASEVNEDNEVVYVEPSFALDSARIHISQKTDIDDNFGLADGIVGNRKARSGIGIKADNIRMIGREGIKLVTKTENKNSQGGDINSVFGVDIIAGNDDSDLQPIVKGNNLREALNKIVEHNKQLTGIVERFILAQMKYNTQIASHVHISPFGGVPTTPSPNVAVAGAIANLDINANSFSSLPLHRSNMEGYKVNYLEPIGKKYINSRYNNVN